MGKIRFHPRKGFAHGGCGKSGVLRYYKKGNKWVTTGRTCRHPCSHSRRIGPYSKLFHLVPMPRKFFAKRKIKLSCYRKGRSRKKN